MKRLTKIFLIVVLLFSLTACFKVNIDVTVDNKGETNCTGSLYMSREVMKQLNLDVESLVSMLQEYGIDINEENYQARIEVEDNTEYQAIFFDIKDVSFIKTEIDDDNLMHVTCANNISDVIFDLDVLNDNEEDLNAYKDLGIEIILTIKMPGRIASSTVGTLSENKKEITINLFETTDSIEIVSEILPSLNLLYALLVITIIALIILIAILIKKLKALKKLKTPKDDTSVISEEFLDKI